MTFIAKMCGAMHTLPASCHSAASQLESDFEYMAMHDERHKKENDSSLSTCVRVRTHTGAHACAHAQDTDTHTILSEMK